MSEPGLLYEAPELAASDPPRSFSAFALTPLPPVAQQGMKYLPWISFAVRCKACGGDDFRLGSRIEADPELSRQAPSNPTLLRPPHRLKCESCGAIETVFDPQTDGYDGVLSGGAGRQAVQGEERFTKAVCKIELGATYNIDLEELKSLAAAAGPPVKATDLFDWINIIATAPDGEPLEVDYECA
jgi:hypothetical protein